MKLYAPKPEARYKQCGICGCDVYKVEYKGETVWMAMCGSEHLELIGEYKEETQVSVLSAIVDGQVA